jgi:hypothetical protein
MGLPLVQVSTNPPPYVTAASRCGRSGGLGRNGGDELNPGISSLTSFSPDVGPEWARAFCAITVAC